MPKGIIQVSSSLASIPVREVPKPPAEVPPAALLLDAVPAEELDEREERMHVCSYSRKLSNVLLQRHCRFGAVFVFKGRLAVVVAMSLFLATSSPRCGVSQVDAGKRLNRLAAAWQRAPLFEHLLGDWIWRRPHRCQAESAVDW